MHQERPGIWDAPVLQEFWLAAELGSLKVKNEEETGAANQNLTWKLHCHKFRQRSATRKYQNSLFPAMMQKPHDPNIPDKTMVPA